MFCTDVSVTLWIVHKVVFVLVIVLTNVINVMSYMTFPDEIEGHEVTVSELLFAPFSGLGFRVWSLGFRVSGLGFRV